MTQKIALPPLVDIRGNINIHGRDSIYWPWKRYVDLTFAEQVDISGYALWFEVNGILRQRLTVDPDDAMGLVLAIPDLAAAGLTITPPNFPFYVIRDETGSQPKVRAQGRIGIYGYEDQPA